MKMAQSAFTLNAQHLAPGTFCCPSQLASIGLQDIRLNIVLKHVSIEKNTRLAHRIRLRHVSDGPASRMRKIDTEALANAKVKKVNDCRMKIHFWKGT